MASNVLYPPTVSTYSPAFVVGLSNSTCRIYFTLSKYSSTTDPIKSVHVSVTKRNSGESVVNTEDCTFNNNSKNYNTNRFRATGIIIINGAPISAGYDNLYYVDILNEDITAGNTNGWTAGWIYKIQLRLSLVSYDRTGSLNQYQWLTLSGDKFSEWSTYCTTKAISTPVLNFPIFKNANNGQYPFSTSTLDFIGSYSNSDNSETLYSYRIKLLNSSGTVLEDSDIIYSNQYSNINQFRYTFKYELKTATNYVVQLTYTTVNKYEATVNFNIAVTLAQQSSSSVVVATLESAARIGVNFGANASINKECDQGRVALKLYDPVSALINGKVCIRRTNSNSNFTLWEDIKVLSCDNVSVNSLPIVYDYTIESGIWYRYGVQIISSNETRSSLNITPENVIREWEYSYILGKDNQQLPLRFNDSVNSYTYTRSESRMDTIGGTYPIVTRNGNMKYRTFPISGLISLDMDEFNTFLSDIDLYKYQEVAALYKARDKKRTGYNYLKEREFREQVIAFLGDGNFKLYKSPTEGNIIVRLMDINLQPMNNLSRLIYTFSANAIEVDDATLENYIKYNLHTKEA